MSDKNLKVTVTGRFIGGALFEPKEHEDGGKPKYSACVVLDEGEDAKVKKLAAAAVKNKWGNKKPGGLQNWTVREGDDEEYEQSFEKLYINPKSTREPQTVIRRNGVMEKVELDDDILYTGCYVAVSVGVYAYDGDKKKGIKPGVTLNLRAAMFLKDGERLSDSVNAENEFDGFKSEAAANDDDFGDIFGEEDAA